jgi:regulator of cell morphogenesis and NO signaling
MNHENLEGLTVGAVAAALPNATRVFEDLGIDYCCGGKRTIAEACAKAGVETPRLIEALRTAEVKEPAVDWRWAPLSRLTEYIVDVHHRYTREALARIDRLSAKVRGVHGELHPELVEVRRACEELVDDLGPHMLKEEAVLFPHIDALSVAKARGAPAPQGPFPSIAHPVRVMSAEHEDAGRIFRTLHALTQDFTPPKDACGSYRALYAALSELERDLHEHIHLESNVLFPRAIELERG